MKIEICEETRSALDEYAAIPIAFEVASVFDVSDSSHSSGAFALTERRLATPYRKDYDACSGEGPAQWGLHFDLTNWGFFAAREEGRLVGGAAMAIRTPGVDMLEGRDDLAVLWDIRVLPDVRGRGVGAALFQAAELWARNKGCRQLKVETQNINVPACKFYARQGCVLKTVNRRAYPELPEEAQLLWYKDI
jgi:GNAT superfamily N-acetyltransferase